MKQRVLTASILCLILVFAFLTRTFTLYIFDALVVGLAVLGALEFSKLLSKCNLYNDKYFVAIYPAISIFLLIYCLINKFNFYLTFVLQIALLLVFFLTIFLFYLIASKRSRNEIKVRKLKISQTNFSFNKGVHSLFAMLYPTVLLFALILINHFDGLLLVKDLEVENLSLFMLILAFVIPIITDTFCMLCGSFFRGKKLCPKISPNKTISGAVGGVLFTVLLTTMLFVILDASNVFAQIFDLLNLQIWHIIILSVVVSVASQCGDLFESFIKRKADEKDSGRILPGHGGVLDRFDSHLFAYVFVLIFFIILL